MFATTLAREWCRALHALLTNHRIPINLITNMRAARAHYTRAGARARAAAARATSAHAAMRDECADMLCQTCVCATGAHMRLLFDGTRARQYTHVRYYERTSRMRHAKMSTSRVTLCCYEVRRACAALMMMPRDTPRLCRAAAPRHAAAHAFRFSLPPTSWHHAIMIIFRQSTARLQARRVLLFFFAIPFSMLASPPHESYAAEPVLPS